MCGINVILGPQGRVTKDNILPMQASLSHRGPDHNAFFEYSWHEYNLIVGSNRLQVVDRNPASNQPFLSPDGRYLLVYNGEIYNYHELKNQLLRKGLSFRTSSDTEVLLYWLIDNGEAGIGELNGMFAFVFIDLQEQSLLVARDRHGIKPLFYHQTDELLIISSELSGILTSGLVAKKLNEAVIPHYLSLKYAPRPATFYKNVYEFEPGDVAHYEKCNLKSKVPYPTQESKKRSDLRTILSDAVASQLPTIGAPGIMLSGGVDSTLLLAIINRELGNTSVDTYTMVFPQGNKHHSSEDRIYAKKAAEQFQSNHHEVEARIDSLNRMSEFIQILDQPVADSGAFCTWLVAENAVKQNNVLLSGAGADEVFGGYNRHWAFKCYLENKGKWWFGLLKKAGQLPSSNTRFQQVLKFTQSLDDDPASTYGNFLAFDKLSPGGVSNPLWEPEESIEGNLAQALQYDKNNFLISDVLAITDRAGMSNSLEIRVPFLDNNVADFAGKYKASDKLKGGTKRLLNELLLSYDGKPYVARKKLGFGLPTNLWFRDKQINDLWSFLDKDAYIFDFVDKPLISRLISDHKRGMSNNSLELWSVLVLHNWLASNFG